MCYNLNMNLPQDNYILLSYINTKLRDEYDSFEELCKAEDISAEEVLSRLSSVGFEYNSSLNVFK